MGKIKEIVSIDDAIQLLNEALKLDPAGMENFILARTRINYALAEHETIQVHGDPGLGIFTVGVLGFLNGLFGISESGWGAIVANFEVACPNGHPREEGKTIEEKCAECDTQLILGRLIEFARVPEGIMGKE